MWQHLTIISCGPLRQHATQLLRRWELSSCDCLWWCRRSPRPGVDDFEHQAEEDELEIEVKVRLCLTSSLLLAEKIKICIQQIEKALTEQINTDIVINDILERDPEPDVDEIETDRVYDDDEDKYNIISAGRTEAYKEKNVDQVDGPPEDTWW